jgi:hypothetical protein
MTGRPTSEDDASAARLLAAEEALRKVQAQAAALEDLSEQLSLSVHVLEAEVGSLSAQLRAAAAARRAAAAPEAHGQGGEEGSEADASGRSTDAEGARLVALNMALAGEPREVTERYVAEHFDVPDCGRLLDEVYAALGT